MQVCGRCVYFFCISNWTQWMEVRGISKPPLKCFSPTACFPMPSNNNARTSEIDEKKNHPQNVSGVPFTARFPSAAADFSLQLLFSDLFLFFFFFVGYCILFKINSFSNINHCAFGCSVFDRRYSEEIKIHRHVSEVVFWIRYGRLMYC